MASGVSKCLPWKRGFEHNTRAPTLRYLLTFLCKIRNTSSWNCEQKLRIRSAAFFWLSFLETYLNIWFTVIYKTHPTPFPCGFHHCCVTSDKRPPLMIVVVDGFAQSSRLGVAFHLLAGDRNFSRFSEVCSVIFWKHFLIRGHYDIIHLSPAESGPEEPWSGDAMTLPLFFLVSSEEVRKLIHSLNSLFSETFDYVLLFLFKT